VLRVPWWPQRRGDAAQFSAKSGTSAIATDIADSTGVRVHH